MSYYDEMSNKHGIEINARWEQGSEHHPEANDVLRQCYDVDFQLYNDHFGWKVGGDGDNGEILIEEMSIVYEIRDAELKEQYPTAFQQIETQEGDSLLEKALSYIEQNDSNK